MRIRTVKFNFIMNAILTVSSILFPLITFPYISRVLLVEGSGKVAFATSVVSYFTMFATLGIGTYGIRECARVRDNKEELSRTVQELLIISGITTAITYGVFFLFLFVVPQFKGQKELLIVIGASIGLTTIGVQWFYSALEQYSYITVCAVLFKIIGLILMFLLVKKPEDYVILLRMCLDTLRERGAIDIPEGADSFRAGKVRTRQVVKGDDSESDANKYILFVGSSRENIIYSDIEKEL